MNWVRGVRVPSVGPCGPRSSREPGPLRHCATPALWPPSRSGGFPTRPIEVLGGRARQEMRSLQSYLRQEIITLADGPTKADLVARIAAVLQGIPETDPTVGTVLADITAERR